MGARADDVLAGMTPEFAATITRKQLCVDPPDGVTRGQLVRVVVADIEARHARMHESFRKLALEALRTAWPCRWRGEGSMSVRNILIGSAAALALTVSTASASETGDN